MITVTDYDAILVPGGGLTPDGRPAPWVRARLDQAVRRWSGQPIIALSAGTTHKPPPADARGFPIFEAVASIRYLQEQGIPGESLYSETASYDTIGNAYFARVVHTDPMGLRRPLVITSEFHVARTRAVFDWIFGLPGSHYSLLYESVPDAGLDGVALRARVERERLALTNVFSLRQSLTSLPELHRWLFTAHSAYTAVPFTPAAGAAGGTY
jgi:hypothetical protein